MKPFNVKEWNSTHREVITKEGDPVKILCTDLNNGAPVVGVITYKNGTQGVYRFYTNGTCPGVSSYDLYFKPVIKTGWIGVYKDSIGRVTTSPIVFATEEDAVMVLDKPVLDIIEIKWEEE